MRAALAAAHPALGLVGLRRIHQSIIGQRRRGAAPPNAPTHYFWRRKKTDNKTIRETHEKLKGEPAEVGWVVYITAAAS